MAQRTTKFSWTSFNLFKLPFWSSIKSGHSLWPWIYVLFLPKHACISLEKKKGGKKANINWHTWVCISSYQEAIEEITRRMGAGMAKFIQKEVKENTSDHCIYILYIFYGSELMCICLSVGWDRRWLWWVLSLRRRPCRFGSVEAFLCGWPWRSRFWFSFKLYGSLSSGNVCAFNWSGFVPV